MNRSPFARTFLLALVLIAAGFTSAWAQITTGTVAGSVKDDQGLRVPGATVTLISEARGTRLASAVTNTNGDFVIPNVAADTYTVEVTMSGFKTLRRPGVAVSGGDRVGVGELSIARRRDVRDGRRSPAEAPLLQSQSGERSFRITTTEVENLPLSNRNFASLAGAYTGVSGTTRLGGGGQNNFMIDGASAMDTGNNGQVLQLNVDAIAEVKVLTAGYQAEFGRSSGLQITAVTKSGTNAFHGSVYDIMRNSDWNSNSWANKINGTPKAEDEADRLGLQLRRSGGQARRRRTSCSSSTARSSGRARPPTPCGSSACRQLPSVPATSRRRSTTSAPPIPALRDATTGGTIRRQPHSRGPALPAGARPSCSSGRSRTSRSAQAPATTTSSSRRASRR